MTTATNPIRVLIVEDSAADARLVSEALSEFTELAVAVTRQRRLSAALALAQESHFDVLLLDLGLPDSRGLDSVVRARAQAPELPIVVLTGWADQDLAMEVVDHGAQLLLVKGEWDATVLAVAIIYAIRKRKHSESAERSLTAPAPPPP